MNRYKYDYPGKTFYENYSYTIQNSSGFSWFRKKDPVGFIPENGFITAMHYLLLTDKKTVTYEEHANF